MCELFDEGSKLLLSISGFDWYELKMEEWNSFAFKIWGNLFKFKISLENFGGLYIPNIFRVRNGIRLNASFLLEILGNFEPWKLGREGLTVPHFFENKLGTLF